LKKVFDTVKNEPFFGTKFSLKNCDNSNNDRYHEAGYDSFITGCCFVQMIRYLCAQPNNSSSEEDFLDNKIVHEFRNKIAIFGNYDIKFLNLQGDDEPLNRNHIFHLNFPKAFTRNDLNLIFAEFGGLNRIVFLDEESAFCIMKDESKLAEAIEALIVNPKGYRYAFQIKHYSEFMNCSPQQKQQQPSPMKLKHHTIKPTTSESVIDESAKKKIKLSIPIKSSNVVRKNSKEMVEKLFDDNLSWTTATN
ncbi:hypothetical protein BLA29_002653, partial [Euroglyphus maynei]